VRPRRKRKDGPAKPGWQAKALLMLLTPQRRRKHKGGKPAAETEE
jgi:hypothetical protein